VVIVKNSCTRVAMVLTAKALALNNQENERQSRQTIRLYHTVPESWLLVARRVKALVDAVKIFFEERYAAVPQGTSRLSKFGPAII